MNKNFHSQVMNLRAKLGVSYARPGAHDAFLQGHKQARHASAEIAAKADSQIAKALEFAVKYGGIDGDHHKAWVIDQMVRALTGCPEIEENATDAVGNEYTYTEQGESDEYKDLVADAKNGSEGPDTYSWKTGIAP